MKVNLRTILIEVFRSNDLLSLTAICYVPCYMLRTYMMFYMSVPPLFCFCSPKGAIMKIRSILTCIMLSLPLYLNCKTFRCVYCFLESSFLYSFIVPFFVVANKYLLTYLLTASAKFLKIPYLKDT